MRLLNIFINRFYLNFLYEFDSFANNGLIENQLKLFQHDKIICLFNDKIKIYSIFEKKILCQINIGSSLSSDNRNIQTFSNNKFILFNSDKLVENENKFIVYQFIENKEKKEYTCKEIFKIKETSNYILIKKNTIICFKNTLINIYNLVNQSEFQLQSKIYLPPELNLFSLAHFCFHKGFLLNDKTILIFHCKENIMKLWTFKAYKFKYYDYIKLGENILYQSIIIEKLKDIDQILININNYIYIYSYKRKKVLNKIKLPINYMDKILGIAILKNGDIYLNDRNYIYALDLENKKTFKLTKKRQFDNSLIVIEKENTNIFILNSKNKIKYFHKSIYITISEDLNLILILWIDFILFLKIFSYNNEINNIKKRVLLLLSIIILLIIKKVNINEKIELIIKSLKISNAIFICIYLFLVLNSFLQNFY